MHRPRRLNPCLLLALVASMVLLACPNDPPPELETVQTPTFTPQGGEYATAQTVFLSCATSGAEIRYTVDDTDPNQTDSTLYNASTGVIVMNNLTLRAKAFKDGMNPSFTGSMSYTILDYPAQVPTPDFSMAGVSLASGIFTSPVQVDPQCDFGPVNFIYTTDGSVPTSDPVHGTLWVSGHITVSRRTTLKMIATHANTMPVIADSEVKEVFYDVFGSVADVGNSSSAYSAACLDSAGKNHLVYWSDPVANQSDKLMYTTDAGGSWLSTPELEVVYTIGAVADMNWRWMAIGVTSNGDVHVVAMRDSGGLRHFVRSNADDTWSDLVIVDPDEATAFVGQYVSMVVDSTDKVRVVYYDETTKDVKHAYFDGAWHAYSLASGGDIGEYCSVAIDSGNFMRVSWYDAGINKDLVYRSSVDDSVTTIDSADDVGKWSSIAVDGNDKVHISYFDESNGDLKYATNASGNWVAEMVDSTGTTGLFTSIAVTAEGIPCITYYSGSGPSYYDLWYAVKPSTTWLTKDMAPGNIKYAHVVVDGNGYARIVYPGKFRKDGP